MCHDFLGSPEDARKFIYRHLAWLSALRYAMRVKRPWESVDSAPNAEFKRNYSVPEKESALEVELMKYVPTEEVARILVANNRAARVLALQSNALNAAFEAGSIEASAFMEMQKAIEAFHEQQSKSELIKNVPYPRQYAIVNTIFVRILCFLLPLGMIGELEKFNHLATGIMRGNMVWLVIPLSVLISWMFLSMDQVGESTANPFEGGANDVPISQICREIELDMRQFNDEIGLSELSKPESNFVL
jgi:putative membrane protein